MTSRKGLAAPTLFPRALESYQCSASMILSCVSQCLWQKILENIKYEKHLFWFTVLGASVHGHLANTMVIHGVKKQIKYLHCTAQEPDRGIERRKRMEGREGGKVKREMREGERECVCLNTLLKSHTYFQWFTCSNMSHLNLCCSPGAPPTRNQSFHSFNMRAFGAIPDSNCNHYLQNLCHTVVRMTVRWKFKNDTSER